MKEIANDQIELALKLHSAEAKILRILKTLDNPEKRFQVLIAAGVLSGIPLENLAIWSGEKKADRVVR